MSELYVYDDDDLCEDCGEINVSNKYINVSNKYINVSNKYIVNIKETETKTTSVIKPVEVGINVSE
jgi:hypothetical protein